MPKPSKQKAEQPLILVMTVPLSSITVDRDLWMRENPEEIVIANYESKYRREVEFPPLIVFSDGKTYWLVDGFLRYEAAKRAGLTHLPMEIHKGSRRDALRYSFSANENNQVTRQQKRDLVAAFLKDPTYGQWNDSAIAKLAMVSASTVAKRRKEMRENYQPKPGPYSLIYCDPAWTWEGIVLDPEETRPGVSGADLCAIDIAAVCARNAILFLQLPARMSVAALDVLGTWGFTYRHCVVWPGVDPSDTQSEEYRFAPVREMLYIATRGDNPPPILEHILNGIYDPFAHPKASRAIIRTFMNFYYHSLKKAELLPRERKLGWDPLYATIESEHQTHNRRSV
jgi:N6-adenosine-specific RNA methylase IME4